LIPPTREPTLRWKRFCISTPITPLTLGDAGRRTIPWTVAQVAKEAGYQTLFVTSARSGWRDLNRVLKVQGFDEVVDANNLKEAYPEAGVGHLGRVGRLRLQVPEQTHGCAAQGQAHFCVCAHQHQPPALRPARRLQARAARHGAVEG